jgi:hypothetical protein
MTNATQITAPRETQGPSTWQLKPHLVCGAGVILGASTLVRSLAG